MNTALPLRVSATVLTTGTSSLPLTILPSTKLISTGTALVSGALSTLLRSNMSCLSLCRFGTPAAARNGEEQERGLDRRGVGVGGAEKCAPAVVGLIDDAQEKSG